ncbi:TIGR02391 family protein [Streptomyces bacillaris]|uniref:TIGR02391 family protein n=1 Tax=Streptomyces bacillaris TaxID=68179 RepID=UPI00365A7EBA
MDAAKNPDYLRKVAGAVTEFQEALTHFLTLHVATNAEGVARAFHPPVVPAEGASPGEISEAAAKVARAAGRAAAAPELTGMKISVEGRRVDPVAAWRTITLPKPMLEPGDVLDAVEQMLGRLEAMTWKAEAELPPTTGVDAMHPTIWGAARKLWEDGHFRLAVQSAAETLTAQVKTRTGLHNLDATNVYEKTFAGKGAHLLQWPGDPNDRTVNSMQNGLSKYAPGVNMTVRNTATHNTGTEMTAQDALERLAALSLLARWIDECEEVV